MFEIYLRKEAQDAMDRDYMYLLTQTTRISNAVRIFLIIANDINALGVHTLLNQIKYLDLLFYQAANLHEILMVLKKDLFPRYKKLLPNEGIIAELRGWIERIEHKDETIKILETIRNKHSYHLAHDSNYLWQYITDGPAEKDKVIGIGETTQNLGWLFTWDGDILLAYLHDHALEKGTPPEESFDRIKDLIDQASIDLHNLFHRIIDIMLKDKIYMKGERRDR